MSNAQSSDKADRTVGNQRQQEIIRAAADLFDQHGYHKVGVQDIARAVGIQKPTIYHYFASKDEILVQIHEEFIDLLLSRQASRQATPMPPSQVLLEIMADILELMDTHRGHVRVFFEHHRDMPQDHRVATRVKRDEYFNAVEDVIRLGISNGEFRETDPRLAGLAIFGACNWAYKWYRTDAGMRPREVAYTFWDLFMRGMQP